MEQWDRYTYGPLEVFSVAGRLMKIGDTIRCFNTTEFTVLLRLMTCGNSMVSTSMLMHGLSDTDSLRLQVYRIRLYLRRLIGNVVKIEAIRGYGYRLFLQGEFSFLTRRTIRCPPAWIRTKDHRGISSAL